MKKIKKCVAGCNVFDGGEIRHHKSCPYYPESFTEMYDKNNERLNILLDGLEYLYKQEDHVNKELLKSYIADTLKKAGYSIRD